MILQDPDLVKRREHASLYFAGDDRRYYANVARALAGLEKDKPVSPRPNTSYNGLVTFPCLP